MAEIEPALTPQEWAHCEATRELYLELQDDGSGLMLEDWEMVSSLSVPPEAFHAIAALALHRQPFGFEAEDVALLRSMALASPYLDDVDAARLRILAERIEALLPPGHARGVGESR